MNCVEVYKTFENLFIQNSCNYLFSKVAGNEISESLIHDFWVYS